MDGWMEHARRAEREHRQLVGGGDTSPLPFRAHFNKLIGSLPPLQGRAAYQPHSLVKRERERERVARVDGIFKMFSYRRRCSSEDTF